MWDTVGGSRKDGERLEEVMTQLIRKERKCKKTRLYLQRKEKLCTE